MPLVIIFEDLYLASKVTNRSSKNLLFLSKSGFFNNYVFISDLNSTLNSQVWQNWTFDNIEKSTAQIEEMDKVEFWKVEQNWKVLCSRLTKIVKFVFCLVLSTQMVLLWANTLSSLCVQISLQHLLYHHCEKK